MVVPPWRRVMSIARTGTLVGAAAAAMQVRCLMQTYEPLPGVPRQDVVASGRAHGHLDKVSGGLQGRDHQGYRARFFICHEFHHPTGWHQTQWAGAALRLGEDEVEGADRVGLLDLFRVRSSWRYVTKRLPTLAIRLTAPTLVP